MASWVSQKKAVLALLDVVGIAAMPVTDHRKTARHRLQYHATESLYMWPCCQPVFENCSALDPHCRVV